MYNHEQNRAVLSFFNFIAWVVVALGVVAAIVGAVNAPEPPFGGRSGSILAFMTPGLIITAIGIFCVIFTAIGLACVDTARSNQELLAIVDRFAYKQTARQDLASSPKASQSTPAPQRAAATAPLSAQAPNASPPAETPTTASGRLGEPSKVMYLGKTIHYDGSTYFCSGRPFNTEAEAKEYVDSTVLIARR